MQIDNHIVSLKRVEVYARDEKVEYRQEQLQPSANRESVEIILAGEIFYTGNDGTIQRFGRGTIIWLQSDEPADWTNVSSDAPYRSAVFSFVTNASKRPVARLGQWQDLTELDNFVYEAHQIFLNEPDKRDSLAIWIYGTLIKQYINKSTPKSLPMPRPLFSAQRHIEHRLPNPVPLKELAAIARCSIMHLHRLFMQHFQMPPAEYILRQRLQRAANLLSTSLAIQRIAFECGFKTVVGFYKAFNKVYGKTPGQYRMEIVAQKHAAMSNKRQ